MNIGSKGGRFRKAKDGRGGRFTNMTDVRLFHDNPMAQRWREAQIQAKQAFYERLGLCGNMETNLMRSV